MDIASVKMNEEALAGLWERLKDEGKISWQTADFLRHDKHFEQHDGDLTIDGDLVLSGGRSLIINGNLTISGAYDDSHGTGHIVVLGDMTAQNVLTWGTSVVTGRLTASELVYCCYNDHISEFRGGVTARALLIFDKSCEYPRKESDIGFCLSDWGDRDHGVFGHLVPELATGDMTEGGFPEYDDCVRIICAGGSVFRDEPADANSFDTAWAQLANAFYDGDLTDLVPVDVMIRAMAAQQEGLSEGTQAALLSYGEADVLAKLAANPATTTAHLAQIMELAPEHRSVVMKNPNTPGLEQGALVDDPDPQVRLALAERADISAEVAARLAADPDPDVRRMLASKAGVHMLDQEALAALAKDTNTQVLFAFVQSGVALDHAICAELAAHSDANVRYFLATCLQQQALWQLPRSLSAQERYDIAEQLVKDPMRRVAAAALVALPDDRQCAAVLDWLDASEKAGEATNWAADVAKKTTSAELMRVLAELPDLRTRERLAENLALSPEVQHMLVDQAAALIEQGDEFSRDDAEVYRSLASNKSAADDVLVRIALLVERLGFGKRMSTGLRHNKDLPPAALEILARMDGDKDSLSDVALTVAHAPRAPRALLEGAIPVWYNRKDKLLKEHRSFAQLSDEAYWTSMARAKSSELREIAAGHHQTPDDLIIALTEDARSDVASIAISNQSLPMDHPRVLQAFERAEDPYRMGDMADLLSEGVLLKRFRAECLKGTAYVGKRFLEKLSARKLKALHGASEA